MKSRIISMAVACVFLIIASFIPPANALEINNYDNIDSPVIAAILSVAEEFQVDMETASYIYADQQFLIALFNDPTHFVMFEKDADIWIEQDGHIQQIHVRTMNLDIVALIEELPISQFTQVTVHDEPPLSNTMSDPNGDSVAPLIQSLIPDFQGMYVRISDGALVVQTNYTSEIPSNARVHLGQLQKNFSVFELVPLGGDIVTQSITIRGGTVAGACTVGFPARNGGRQGIVTAAHCDHRLAVFGNTAGTGTSVLSTWRADSPRSNADIAFHEVPGTMTSQFFGISAAQVANMGAPQEVIVGVTVCGRGRVSLWRCGRVDSVSHRPSNPICNNNLCNPTFVSVIATNNLGDSGGPWVIGNSPVGIHAGGNSEAHRAVFSRLAYIPNGTTLGN